MIYTNNLNKLGKISVIGSIIIENDKLNGLTKKNKYSKLEMYDEIDNKIIFEANSECCDISWIEIDNLEIFYKKKIKSLVSIYNERIPIDEYGDYNSLFKEIYQVCFDDNSSIQLTFKNLSNGFYRGWLAFYIENNFISNSTICKNKNLGKKIIIVIGPPGSGKTYFTNSYSNDFVKIDDYFSSVNKNKILLDDSISKCKDIIINDPFLMVSNNLLHLIRQINYQIKTNCNSEYSIEFVIFKWNKKRCIKNLTNRVCEDKRKNKENIIDMFFENPYYYNQYNKMLDYLRESYNSKITLKSVV